MLRSPVTATHPLSKLVLVCPGFCGSGMQAEQRCLNGGSLVLGASCLPGPSIFSVSPVPGPPCVHTASTQPAWVSSLPGAGRLGVVSAFPGAGWLLQCFQPNWKFPLSSVGGWPSVKGRDHLGHVHRGHLCSPAAKKLRVSTELLTVNFAYVGVLPACGLGSVTWENHTGMRRESS